MRTRGDNQSWIVNAGDVVIRKKGAGGVQSLTSPERLIYCLWVADYGMRNAGDLETARDLYRGFQEEAARLSLELRLPFTHETFSLSADKLEQEYLDRFERICDEIKKA